jgi:glutamate synthase domain-containing protein 2
MQVNSTLLAVIGTLLLAMGVGVLIGRSGNNASVKSPPAQVVTIAGAAAGTGASTPTSTPATPQAPAAGVTQAKKSSPTSSSAKSAPKKSAAPAPKAVKVGSAGKGSGYQQGHFTGNFFGPESEK